MKIYLNNIIMGSLIFATHYFIDLICKRGREKYN